MNLKKIQDALTLDKVLDLASNSEEFLSRDDKESLSLIRESLGSKYVDYLQNYYWDSMSGSSDRVSETQLKKLSKKFLEDHVLDYDLGVLSFVEYLGNVVDERLAEKLLKRAKEMGVREKEELSEDKIRLSEEESRKWGAEVVKVVRDLYKGDKESILRVYLTISNYMTRINTIKSWTFEETYPEVFKRKVAFPSLRLKYALDSEHKDLVLKEFKEVFRLIVDSIYPNDSFIQLPSFVGFWAADPFTNSNLTDPINVLLLKKQGKVLRTFLSLKGSAREKIIVRLNEIFVDSFKKESLNLLV